MRGCLRDCAFFLKNPVVLIFLLMCGFIQLIIFFANFYDTSSSNNSLRSSSTSKKSDTGTNSQTVNRGKGSNALRLDWEFNTVFKVLEVNANYSNHTSSSLSTTSRSHSSVTASQLLPTGDFIHYGSEDFQYPLLVDMLDIVQKIKTGKRVSVAPVNKPNFQFVIANPTKCHFMGSSSNAVDLIILIKSAPGNSLARQVIRDTWGKDRCWGGRLVRHVFLFGRAPPGDQHETLEKLIQEESIVHGDVIQQEFVDHYFNNTYKMMMGFQWALEYCSNARDILFVDDDYFVHPRTIIAYLESMSEAMRDRLVAGHVYRVAYPIRSKRGPTQKWFIAYHEYPWNTYPPYCAAGAFFASMRVAKDLYIAMHYTRYLRFDDVFLGIILHKLSMTPMHLAQVHSFTRADSKGASFTSVLASHGYKEPHDIFQTWQQLNCAHFCVNVTS